MKNKINKYKKSILLCRKYEKKMEKRNEDTEIVIAYKYNMLQWQHHVQFAR